MNRIRASRSDDAGGGGGAAPMGESDDKAPVAWQPVTLRGVAAFASATFGRLLLVQFIVALLVAATVVWFVHRAWFPIIGQAIRRMPSEGEVRSGRLNWPGTSPMLLAEGRFLALVVDLDHTGKARSPAHVQVEFGREDFMVHSLLGYVQGVYPRTGVVAFNRTELEPWWGAWAPPILAVMAGLVVVALIAIWTCLATAYCLPAWMISFFADRDCSLGGSWRLAGAALMPGALLMSAAMLVYGLGALDLVRLTLIGGMHLIVGWIYVVASPFCLPRRRGASAKANPFA